MSINDKVNAILNGDNTETENFLNTLYCSLGTPAESTKPTDLILTDGPDAMSKHIMTVSLTETYRDFVHKHLSKAENQSDSSPFSKLKPGKFADLLEAGSDDFVHHVFTDMENQNSLLTDFVEMATSEGPATDKA
jgi:hypothetical protein